MQNSARGQRSGISSFHFTTKTTKPPSISCSISYQLPIFYSTAWSQLTGNSSSHHLPQKMNVSYIDIIQYNTKVQNMLLGVKLQACRCSPKHEGESRELDWPANYRMVTSHKHWVGVSTGSLMRNSARGQRSGISSFHFTTKTTKPPSISCSISYQLPIFYSTAWSQLTGNSSSHHLPRKMNVYYIAMIQHNTKVQNMLPGVKLQACRCSPKHEGETRELDWPANYRMVTSRKRWVGVSTGSLMQNSARGKRSGISSFHFTTKTTKPPSNSCSISYQLPIFYSTAWSQLTGNSSSHHLPRKMNVSYIAMIQHNTKVQNMLLESSCKHADVVPSMKENLEN